MRVFGAFQMPSANDAVPELIVIRTIGTFADESVLRPTMISGVLVCSERRMAHRVVLPRPFSPKIRVNFLKVTSPEAEAERKRPTELMTFICWRDMSPP
jgi:hypothetical protein